MPSLIAVLMGPSGTVTCDLHRVVIYIVHIIMSLSVAWTLRLFATACVLVLVLVIFILLILFVVVRAVIQQRPQTRRGSVALMRASHFAVRVSDEIAVR